ETTLVVIDDDQVAVAVGLAGVTALTLECAIFGHWRRRGITLVAVELVGRSELSVGRFVGRVQHADREVSLEARARVVVVLQVCDDRVSLVVERGVGNGCVPGRVGREELTGSIAAAVSGAVVAGSGVVIRGRVVTWVVVS